MTDKKRGSDMLVAYLVRYHKKTGRPLPIRKKETDKFLAAINRIGFYGCFRYGPMSEVIKARRR